MTTHRNLFPAYASSESGDAESKEDVKSIWLTNSSFKADTTTLVPKQREEHDGADNNRASQDSSSVQSIHEKSSSYGLGASDSSSRTHHPKKKRKHKHKHGDGERGDKKRRSGHSSEAKGSHHHAQPPVKPAQPPVKPAQPPVKPAQPPVKPALPSGKLFIEDIPGLEIEHAFRIDHKKDDNNIVYGGLYKMHIAKYRQKRACCLGVRKGELVIMKTQRLRHSHPRYFSKEFRNESRQTKATPVTRDTLDSTVEDFIALTSSDHCSQQVASAINPLGVYDSATELYLQGLGVHDKQSLHIEEKPYDCLLKQKTEMFNEKLRSDPHNTSLWLEFVEFQSNMSAEPEHHAKDANKKNTCSRAVQEIQLAILDRALQHNPSSIPLKLAQLELCKELWESEKLTSEWKDFVFRHPNNPSVWIKYLEFVRSRFSSFTVSATMKVYAKCLQMLNQIRQGQLISHEAHPFTTEYMIAIFAELCELLRQAEHTEKAVALYQAQVEFSLFHSPLLKDVSLEEQHSLLEAFWESPAARVGEDGSVGWAVWIEKKGDTPAVKPWTNRAGDEEMEEKLVEETEGKQVTWVAMERCRASRHWLPWRPDFEYGEDEEDCEDTDRLILSDDLTPFVFYLATEEHRFQLLGYFLTFLGVHTQGHLKGNSHNFYLDTVESVFDRKDCQLFVESSLGKVDTHINKEKFIANTFRQCLPCFSGDLKTKLLLLMVKHKAQQCMDSSSNLDKKSRKLRVKELSKELKLLLSQEENRNNVLLWEAYAAWEVRGAGSVEGMRRVLNQCLASLPVSATPLHSDKLRCKLYKTQVELELGLGSCDGSWSVDDEARPDGVLNKLCTMVCVATSSNEGRVTTSSNEGCVTTSSNEGRVTPVMILKARRSFEQGLQKLLQEVNINESDWTLRDRLLFDLHGCTLLHWTQCFAVFQYLSLDLTSASCVYQHVLNHLLPLQKSSDRWGAYNLHPTYLETVHERCSEMHISLLHYLTHTHNAPHSLLRGPLITALKCFPDNCFFWACFSRLEARARIRGRVRALVHQVTKTPCSATVWLYAILTEMKHIQAAQSDLPASGGVWMRGSGLSHQLRAWLERGVSSERGHQCVLLWRLYHLVELRLRGKEAAANVFYRAIQVCPWAKGLYMDHIETGHLQEATDLMTEKEVRLRTPLEELDLLVTSAEGKQGKVEEEVEELGLEG